MTDKLINVQNLHRTTVVVIALCLGGFHMYLDIYWIVLRLAVVIMCCFSISIYLEDLDSSD